MHIPRVRLYVFDRLLNSSFNNAFSVKHKLISKFNQDLSYYNTLIFNILIKNKSTIVNINKSFQLTLALLFISYFSIPTLSLLLK